MFYAIYSCVKDFSFSRPCTGILWYNTLIDTTAQEGEMQGAASTVSCILKTIRFYLDKHLNQDF